MKHFSIALITAAMAAFSVTSCVQAPRIEASGINPKSTSPDGQKSYKCGTERNSAVGCFNAWTKIIHDGEEGEWEPAHCRDQPDQDSAGYCYGGGVPWWWWKGSGKIGDSQLNEFWFRDYAGPEVNGVFRNDNSYGDAHRLPGPNNCYKAKESIFCMKLMDSR